MRSFCISFEDSSVSRSPEQACWPSEDIFEVREATHEDDENTYFFPKGGTSGSQPDGFNPRSAQIRESMHDNLKVLGVPTGDLPSLEMVRGAYRKQALRAHPDKGGTKEQFQNLQNAYEAVIEVLARIGGGVQSEVETHHGPHAGRQSETPEDSNMNRGVQEIAEVSEAEKAMRRQRALEAALRRQGQTS